MVSNFLALIIKLNYNLTISYNYELAIPSHLDSNNLFSHLHLLNNPKLLLSFLLPALYQSNGLHLLTIYDSETFIIAGSNTVDSAYRSECTCQGLRSLIKRLSL